MNVSPHVSNPLNYSVPNLPMMGLNGVPPHHSSALYQSVSANSGMSATQEADYWNAKMGLLSTANANLGNGMAGNQSANTEHKIVSNFANK